MNNLDDFLNSLGIAQPTAPLPESASPEPSTPVEPEPSPEPAPPVTIPQQSQPESLSDQEFLGLLEGISFNTPPDNADAEELHDGSDDEGAEDEEDNTDSPLYMSGGIMAQINNFNSISGDAHTLFPHFVNGELVNIGDFRVNHDTEEIEMLTENGIVTVSNVSENIRDLDAEEDADWQEALMSVPIVTEEQSQELHELEQTAIGAYQAVVEAPQQQEPLIPLNSPTLLIDESTTRFSGAEWYNEIQKKRVIFAGLGGIGSWASLLLGRMALQTLVLYDDDKIEPANMSGQLYPREAVGKYKADAMRSTISKYTSTTSVFAVNQRFGEESTAGDIMICGFDNMAARKTFFQAWKNHIQDLYLSDDYLKKCLFIDGRLSIDTLQVFCIQGTDTDNIERYEREFLFSDEDADETICSMKQTSYLAAMIGSVITNLFTNWVANSIDPIIPYDVPFFTEYDAQHMIFKTEH